MDAYQMVISGDTLCLCENDEARMCLQYSLVGKADSAAAADLFNLLMNGEAVIYLDFEEIQLSFSGASEVFVATGTLERLQEFCTADLDNVVIGLAVPMAGNFEDFVNMLVPLQQRMGEDTEILFGVAEAPSANVQAAMVFTRNRAELEEGQDVLGG